MAANSARLLLRRFPVLSEHQLWLRVREIAEDLDQAEALAHEHHVLTEPSESAEIGPMGATPTGQAPIAFALIVRKGSVNFIEMPIGYLGGLDNAARFSTPVQHDPAFAGRRGVRLVFRATGCGLHALDYECEQFVCELGTVAERECSEVLIPLGDRLAHGLPNLQKTTAFGAIEGQPNWPDPERKCLPRDKGGSEIICLLVNTGRVISITCMAIQASIAATMGSPGGSTPDAGTCHSQRPSTQP